MICDDYEKCELLLNLEVLNTEKLYTHDLIVINFKGAAESVYAGEAFEVQFQIPQDYP